MANMHKEGAGEDYPIFSQLPLGEVQRDVFESGRFAIQTNDPEYGPSEELLPQHLALAKKKIELARESARRAGFSDQQIHALYWQGASYHLRKRGNY